jgi:hypothetical protein
MILKVIEWFLAILVMGFIGSAVVAGIIADIKGGDKDNGR